MLKFILSCVLFYLHEALSIERSLIITTESGPVKGKLNDYNGIEFYSYQGIPYAESPTGNLRFKPPEPKRPWTDVRDATEEGAICSQIPKFHRIEQTSEDCLNVNVYVPKNGTDKLLPVMVFIHGGALQCLSGHIDVGYGPQFLIGREIVYVSMNYRLGPFGFLSLDIKEASGNAGLKDVLLSLKWVKKNIENFGGDPNKITIAGHSSGSLIVNLLILTNQSNGLFNQALQISGNAFTPRSFAKHSKDISFALAKELRIDTGDVYKMLDKLQKIDAVKILRAYIRMSKSHDSPLRVYAPFVPTKEVESDHALFTVDPMEALRNNKLIIQKVPILVGITSRESINMIPYVLKKKVGIQKIRDNPEYLVPSNIEYPIGSQRSKNLAKLLSETYFGEKMQNLTTATLIEFMSDAQNVYGGYFWINKYKNVPDSKAVYLYMFDFKGKLNRNQFFFNTTVQGIGHGDDIPYIFVTNITYSMFDSIDQKTRGMRERMVNYISNFVHNGNPTPQNLNNELLWREYNKEQSYLLLNDNPTLESFSTTPIYARMQIWDKVYDQYYKYLEKGGETQKKMIP